MKILLAGRTGSELRYTIDDGVKIYRYVINEGDTVEIIKAKLKKKHAPRPVINPELVKKVYEIAELDAVIGSVLDLEK